MSTLFTPPIIGLSSYTVAADDSTAFAKRHANHICDGTDDQDDINSVLEDGPVRLCAGTYNISESVIVPDKGRLSGDGNRTTIIQPIATFAATAAKHVTNMIDPNFLAAIVTDPAGGTSNVLIEDLTIEGNSVNQTEQGHSMAGLLILGSDYAKLRNVTSRNVLLEGFNTLDTTRQMCICINQSNYTELWGCDCLRSGYESLGIRDDSDHTTVHGGVCAVSGIEDARHAAQCYGAEGHLPAYTKFIGTIFRRDNFAAQAGGFISHGSHFNILIGCTFDGCWCTFNAATKGTVIGGRFLGWPAGIIIAGGSTGITFSQCPFINSGDVLGISGSGNADISLLDSHIDSLGYGLTFSDGASAVDNLRIEGNSISAVGSVFRMIGTLTKPRIRGNVLRGTPNYAFNLTGGTISGAVIENNNVEVATNASYNAIAFPADTIARGNSAKIKTRNSGTATVANGATVTSAISHGLYATPTADQIKVTPTLLSNAKGFYVDTIGATTFLIHTDADPGAGTATFSWEARCLGD